MTTPFGEPSQENYTGEQGQGQPGINPAWNEALSQLPQEFHSKVIPTFQKWDQNHTQGVQKVHSQYEPYKEFVDSGVDPEQIRIAMGITQLLETNPQAVYDALHADYGQHTQDGGQMPQDYGFGEQGSSGEEYEGLPPEFMQRFSSLEEQNNAMREILMQQHQSEQEKQEDAVLDGMYSDLAQRSEVFKELNKDGRAEPFVNTLFMAGYNAEQAAEAFEDFIDSVRSYSNRPKPPTILGSGGYMPERTVRPRDLSDKDANKLMVDMIQSALHNQG